MHYRLNLDLSPNRFTIGSIQMFLNWANRVDGEGTEPAMIFVRAQSDRRQVAALRLSELHNVMASSGYGLGGIVALGMGMAEAIGCSRGDKFAARDVADLIVEYAEDLKNMPADPPAVPVTDKQPQQKAELSVTLDGETIAEMEVAA